jgi:predicted PurR-regulated permease PerM
MSSNISGGVPVYAKACIILLLNLLIGGIIYIGQDIIVPFGFALLIAVLLLPVVKWMERKGVNRIIAIMICLICSLLILTALIYFLTTQVLNFTRDIPAIKKQLHEHSIIVQHWLTDHFHISKREQTKLVNDATGNIASSSFIGDTVWSLTQVLSVLVLLPVYCFLCLYYRDMIYNFFIKIFDKAYSARVKEVLQESRYIVQGYMVGLILEMAIVTTINSFGFIVLGIKYAIFLGLLAAILNMIPYIGMLIASVFCALITLSTSNQISDVIGVVVVLTVVQFIDNNIIMPKVVSSKVKINALITILGVLVGGALAGISGMFLSIPVIAILKVIFDRVEGLEPWGMLLGDDITGKKAYVFRKKKPVSEEEKTALPAAKQSQT